MNDSIAQHYDVAIVGAGPVGSLCALAHARKGVRVALFEANPKASKRLAGEWLHPPAVKILKEFGIEFDTANNASVGEGFIVYPEDGLGPIQLPYTDGSLGMKCEHAQLVSRLHECVDKESKIDFFLPARVHEVEDGRLKFKLNKAEQTVTASTIVGADGRASIVRQSLGLSTKPQTCSRMVGVIVEGGILPIEGYGFVLLGGPGPILMYDLGNQRIRIIVDVPLDHWSPRDRTDLLIDSYSGLLPEGVRRGFVETIHAGQYHAAANELRPRLTYGNSNRVLIGDAAGHYHPMTAVGMTLGFGDAVALATSKNFHDFSGKRFLATRSPELLAMGLYEVFSDYRVEMASMRRAMYRNWRTSHKMRVQTTRLLACEETSVFHLTSAFSNTLLKSITENLSNLFNSTSRRRSNHIFNSLTVRLYYFVRGALQQRKVKKVSKTAEDIVRGLFSRAFQISMPTKGDVAKSSGHKHVESVNASFALETAVQRLLAIQNEDGSWEGEMVWCPMLTAQYVLLHYLIGQPLTDQRRERILRQFEHTRLEQGCWGMHEHSSAHLFVTTLVYIACRLLGMSQDDPLMVPARKFLQDEEVINIPSWGKFWLALLNLYEWQGMNAIVPELWRLPKWLAVHPSKWYCHTRLIYMSMSMIYAHRYQTPVDSTIQALREELYPQGYSSAAFSKARNRLRDGDLFAKPSIWLGIGFRLAGLYDRIHAKRLRTRCVDEITERIKWELRSSSYTSISPVSGLLNIFALWMRDEQDTDCRAAIEKLEDWIWEDEKLGARVTGARSASWDTGFALQALSTVSRRVEVETVAKDAVKFLYENQIKHSFEGFRQAYRNDPKGGWCFAGGWHGWPVTDCTAEALLGIISIQGKSADKSVVSNGIQFMLRGQNQDGGFGSYEARRSIFGLEWANPAEMFGESMTENSFVECTASCLSALAACKRTFPNIVDSAALDAIGKADAWLRNSQQIDGSWRGVWGVQYIYGTLFGIRGLLSGGAGVGDPNLRLACRWLLERQRSDGGWGEHHSGCMSGVYVEHEQSQIIHTAWALIALLEASESNWMAICRGIQFLMDSQNDDGTWPKQDMAGVFFRTALLDYILYRQYFPLHALGLYEKRRRQRQLHQDYDHSQSADV